MQRSGYAWIFRQLGSDEAILDRLADGDGDGVLKDLTQRAAAGDHKAVNMLGFLASHTCGVRRNEEQIADWEAIAIEKTAMLNAADSQWFADTLRQEDATELRTISACQQLTEQDKDQLSGWIEKSAAAGDGASLWLRARSVFSLDHMRSVNSMDDVSQYAHAAAAAGFAQAQLDLAIWMLNKPAGIGQDRPNTDSVLELLRQAAPVLPLAKANLAICEYTGCQGAPTDLEHAVVHAREAAEMGATDAIINLGPHLPVGQLDPGEVAAWKLIPATLQQRGCSGQPLTPDDMISSSQTLASATPTAQSRATQLWSQYGSQMLMSNGCRP